MKTENYIDSDSGELNPRIKMELLKNKEYSLSKSNDLLQIVSKMNDNMQLMADRIFKLEEKINGKK
tara:strand:- start:293 stop:490 length:198 start_codon:yes stop_codon:yes gene_type:complete